MKVFIAHYTPLKDRKDFQTSQCQKFGIDPEFVEIYNREDLSEDDINKFDTNRLNLSKISLSLKHHFIYREIVEKYDYALILEDDSVFVNNFTELIDRCIKELPESWDTIFIGDCCNLHIPSNPSRLIYPKGNQWHEYGLSSGAGSSRGTGAYFVSKEGAKKILRELEENKEKIFHPVDWWLNDVFRKYDMKCFWSEPVLVYQGSETGLFKTSLG